MIFLCLGIPKQKVVVGEMLKFSTFMVIFDRKPDLVLSFNRRQRGKFTGFFKIIRRNERIS